MNDPYASTRYDPLTRHTLALKEAAQLRESAERLVAESSAMFAEAHERSAGRHRPSIVRVINAVINRGRLDGIEGEVSQECAHRMGLGHDVAKPWVSWSMLSSRALVAGTAAAGGNLVGKVASAAVDALHPVSMCVRLGVQVVDGLAPGNLLVPRVATSGTASWPGETGTAATSDQVLGQIEASPKRVVSITPVSKRLLVQAPEVSDRMISANLRGVVAAGIDSAILNGTGTTMPTGIRLTSGITLTTGTSFTHANGQAMIKNVSGANVADENIRALGAPTVRETLSLRGLNGTGAEAGYVWQGGKFCSSVPALVSSNVSAGQLFLGDFTQTWLLMWSSGIQLEMNPYDQFMSDIVQVRAVAYVDVAVTQPGAYHVSTGLT